MPLSEIAIKFFPRTYGTNSPVVIVLNKFNAHSFSIDEFDLKDRYSEVKAVVQADCDPHFKIDDVQGAAFPVKS